MVIFEGYQLNTRTKGNLLEEKMESRLEHVRLFFLGNDPVPGLLKAIKNRTGDTPACILTLSSFAIRNAILSWFDAHDIQATKTWFNTSATLRKIRYEMVGQERFNVGTKFLELMAPLVTDSNELIDWYANTDINFDLKRVEDPKTQDFWSYQAIVALRGDWSRLRSRCEKILADPSVASKKRKYMIDHRFYLALARGDEETMTNVIRELSTPKMIAARRNDESGFTCDLLSTPSVIFSKLAWRAGFHIDTKSPFVPSEWLPIAQPQCYDDLFHILQ
jgi:hypothetical protein